MSSFKVGAARKISAPYPEPKPADAVPVTATTTSNAAKRARKAARARTGTMVTVRPARVRRARHDVRIAARAAKKEAA